MLARLRVWLSAREHPRGRIAETTPWTSMLKVAQSSRSATSLIWVQSSVQMGLLKKKTFIPDSKGVGCFLSTQQYMLIWYSRNIKTPTKVRIYKAAVLTILLYGSEVWNTTQTQMKRFEVFHHRCLRKILKIKWNYFVSNAEVLKRANIAPVDVFIRAARLR